MIVIIEGGMTIPMGTLTKNFFRFFRLSPTQCAPNMFKVLGSIEALNERMKGQGYYLKSRYPEIRLIQCLSISNKGLNDDFFNFSG